MEQRNNDYNRICSSLLTEDGIQWEGTLCDHYDRVFFFGDLNYRINGNKRIVEDSVKRSLIEVCITKSYVIRTRLGQLFVVLR